jgi:hypothetical protein
MRCRALGLLLAVSACAPPPPPIGFVSVEPGERGQVDLSAAAGGGGHAEGGGGAAGTIHVEPYASPHTSIPMPRGGGGAAIGFGAGRVGVRHRLDRPLTIGGGVSAGYPTSVGPDFELVTGWSAPRVGGSFGLRPGLQFVPGDINVSSFQITTDFSLRFYGPQRRGGFDLGFFFYGGSTFDGYPLVGGGLGLGGGGHILPRKRRR